MSATVLWVIAVVLAVIGIVQLLQGQLIFGIILLIVAAAVGPSGWSVFRSRRCSASYGRAEGNPVAGPTSPSETRVRLASGGDGGTAWPVL